MRTSPYVAAVIWACASPVFAGPWLSRVTACLDTLIERGVDVYGPVHSPMLMSVIDVRTLNSPENPAVYDSLIRLEGRIHRRGERGADLWNDQPTLHAMYLVSERTGKRAYAEAADAYIKYALEHCRKPNGLLVWGSHIYWDCYEERPAGDRNGAGPHEILVHQCHWPELYRIDPDAVRAEIDGIWQWHVHNHETGRHNRHDDGHPGADFPFSGSSFIEAFAFMHSVLPPGDQQYLDRARLVTDWHYRHRNPETNLVAFQPGNLLHGRKAWEFYGTTFASAITGPHAAALLRCSQRTGEAYFRQVAVDYLLAYDKYGWREDEQTFVGMLNLDGSITTADDAPEAYQSQLPDRAEEPDPEYSVPPIGPVDMWPTTIYPLDYPLLTAQSSIYAYELTPPEDEATRRRLLTMARHWATAIEQALPAGPGRTFRQTLAEAMPGAEEGGTYAANYGRAISFLLHLYRATSQEKYLKLAEDLARDAVQRLYVTVELDDEADAPTYGIFRGHPAKPYYEAVDGVGFLLLALIDLETPESPDPHAF